MAIDLSDIDAITFDCYGTLIDWETGILACLRPMLGPAPADADILVRHAFHERALESGPYMSYRDILRDVAELIGRDFGKRLSSNDRDEFAFSVGDWPAYPDTPAALDRLHKHAKLAIVSNIDHDLFARTLPKLEITPDYVVTAEDCRSYKPNLTHFRVAMERINLPPARMLHTAESRYHDIEPANQLGIPCAWVMRRNSTRPGASGTGEGRPDITVTTLAELADLFDAC